MDQQLEDQQFEIYDDDGDGILVYGEIWRFEGKNLGEGAGKGVVEDGRER